MSRLPEARAHAAASSALAVLLAAMLTAPVGASPSASDVTGVAGAPSAGRLADPPAGSAPPPWRAGATRTDVEAARTDGGGSHADVAAPLGEPADVAAWLAQAGDPASTLVVVNKRRPLTAPDFVPADLDGTSGVLLRADASAAFLRLAAAAQAAGVPVRARSGYRSALDQQVTYRRWQRVLGDDAADAQSARPGYSEHQTGLAVDVVTRDDCQDFGCFTATAQAAWLAEHAADHGFLVRYQPGQEAITGYGPEPWHLRFVGVDAARAVAASGAQSIEEYLGLPAAPTY